MANDNFVQWNLRFEERAELQWNEGTCQLSVCESVKDKQEGRVEFTLDFPMRNLTIPRTWTMEPFWLLLNYIAPQLKQNITTAEKLEKTCFWYL